MEILRKDSNDFFYSPDWYHAEHPELHRFPVPDINKINFELKEAPVNCTSWTEQLEWAENNLQGIYCLWNDYYRYFEFEDDMLLFILRWCG